MSELRRDPQTCKWTIISPERSRRKDAFLTKRKSDARCPFCGEGSGLYEIYKIDGQNGWELKVVPNRYPVLGIEGNLERFGHGLCDKITGIGANEIIIDSARHGLKASDYTESELLNLFRAFKVRMEDLAKDLRFRYIMAFKSIGEEAGAVINHPHAQIVALPVVPPAVLTELKAANAYYAEKERCLSCDLLEEEMKDRSGIVLENHDFIALCPYGAAHPFHVAVYPKKHGHSFALCSDSGLKQLAEIVKEIYLRLSSLLNSPAVMMAISSAPLKDGRPDFKGEMSFQENSFHWHIDIRPVITGASCFEWASGMTANPVPPEMAASYLREVAVR